MNRIGTQTSTYIKLIIYIARAFTINIFTYVPSCDFDAHPAKSRDTREEQKKKNEEPQRLPCVINQEPEVY